MKTKTALTTTQVQPGVWRTSDGRFDLIKGAKGYTVQEVGGPTVAGPYPKKAAAMHWCQEQPGQPSVPPPTGPSGEARYLHFVQDGAKLTTYASGDGSISFTYVKRRVEDGQLISTGSPQTVDEVPSALVKEGWLIGSIRGQVKMFEPVTRIGEDRLILGGTEYTYSLEHRHDPDHHTYRFFFHHPAFDRTQELINISRKSGLTFFLNNEEAITTQRPAELVGA